MLTGRLKMNPNLPDVVYYFISIMTSEIELKEKKSPNRGKCQELWFFLLIWIGKFIEVAYTDLVLLGNFNRHMDKPNLICACFFGLQYSHTIKLLSVHDVHSKPYHPSWHREYPFTGCTCSKINQQKLTNNHFLVYHVSLVINSRSVLLSRYRQSPW